MSLGSPIFSRLLLFRERRSPSKCLRWFPDAFAGPPLSFKGCSWPVATPAGTQETLDFYCRLDREGLRVCFPRRTSISKNCTRYAVYDKRVQEKISGFFRNRKTRSSFSCQPLHSFALSDTIRGQMKTLNDEIEARLAEILPDCDQSTSVGFLQWNACRNTLERGNLLLIRRKPGGFPETHSIPQRKIVD